MPESAVIQKLVGQSVLKASVSPSFCERERRRERDDGRQAGR